MNDAELIRRAIRLASQRDDGVYALGPHPLLIMRIIEALCGLGDPVVRETLRRELVSTAAERVRQEEDASFRWLWRVVKAGCEAPLRMTAFRPIDPLTVALDRFYYCRGAGRPEADGLQEFLLGKGVGIAADASRTPPPKPPIGDVLLVLQRDSKVPLDVAYGSTRIAMEVMKRLNRAGCLVALAGCGANSVGMAEGLLYFSRESEPQLLQGVRKFGRLDALLGVSRGDAVAVSQARRAIVYHHGPHPIQGLWSNAILHRFRIPVVCLSQSSAREQIGFGLRRRQVSWVYSGFNPHVYRPDPGTLRSPHLIVFAGGIIDYKGVDIALRAFALIRKEVPDAIFHLCGGNTYAWHKAPAHLLPASWCSESGGLDFDVIEGQLPGVSYCGEKKPDQLAEMFRRASLLIMPSLVAETFGLVSIEAQACGCIPVLPRHGAFPETLREGETGFLYDTNTPEELAATVINLWRRGLPSPILRENAVRFVNETFSWTRTGDGVLSALQQAPRRTRAAAFLMYAEWFHDACRALYGSDGGIVRAAAGKMLARLGLGRKNTPDC